jgi:hypothetical protein
MSFCNVKVENLVQGELDAERFRGVSPKVHWSGGPLVQRFVSPKVR